MCITELVPTGFGCGIKVTHFDTASSDVRLIDGR